MSDCKIELNFFELHDLEIIEKLLVINRDIKENDLSWFKGQNSKTHGGFVAKKGSKHVAFILPKIKKLTFKKINDRELDDQYNTESIPGQLVLQGRDQILKFSRINDEDGERKRETLLEFELCKTSRDLFEDLDEIEDDESKSQLLSASEYSDDESESDDETPPGTPTQEQPENLEQIEENRRNILNTPKQAQGANQERSNAVNNGLRQPSSGNNQSSSSNEVSQNNLIQSIQNTGM